MPTYSVVLYSIIVTVFVSVALSLLVLMLPRRKGSWQSASLRCIQYVLLINAVTYCGFFLRFYDLASYSVVLTNGGVISSAYVLFISLVTHHRQRLNWWYYALIVLHVVAYTALQLLSFKHIESEMFRDILTLINLTVPLGLIIYYLFSRPVKADVADILLFSTLVVFWTIFLVLYPIYHELFNPDVVDTVYFLSLGLLLVQGMLYASVAYNQLTNLTDKLKSDAYLDTATGMKNRLYLKHVSVAVLSAAERYRFGNCLLMADLNDCFRVKQRYGQLVKDHALQHIGQMLQQNIRSQDVLVRFGGESFVIMLPNTHLTSAYAIARRVQHGVSEGAFTIDDQLLPLTVSIGVSAIQDSEDFMPAIDRAEKAMRQAREQAQNGIVVADAISAFPVI